MTWKFISKASNGVRDAKIKNGRFWKNNILNPRHVQCPITSAMCDIGPWFLVLESSIYLLSNGLTPFLFFWLISLEHVTYVLDGLFDSFGEENIQDDDHSLNYDNVGELNNETDTHAYYFLLMLGHQWW